MRTDKNLYFEIILVVLLTAGRSIANNFAVIFWLGNPPIRPFGYFQFTECLRGLYLSVLVLLVVSIKKESWAELGLTAPLWIRDFIIALLLIFMTMLLWIPFSLLIEKLGLFVYQKPPIPFVSSSTAAEAFWICITAMIVGFGEELLIRGYLLSRLLRVSGPLVSVLCSSLVFSAWHTSSGLFAVAHTFIWGLVYGWTFTKMRRLYPLALAHAINNIIAFLWV
jgi:membrane protease YdiL (CAAX protease family)